MFLFLGWSRVGENHQVDIPGPTDKYFKIQVNTNKVEKYKNIQEKHNNYNNGSHGTVWVQRNKLRTRDGGGMGKRELWTRPISTSRRKEAKNISLFIWLHTRHSNTSYLGLLCLQDILTHPIYAFLLFQDSLWRRELSTGQRTRQVFTLRWRTSGRAFLSSLCQGWHWKNDILQSNGLFIVKGLASYC